MAVQWSDLAAINYNEAYDCGLEAYILWENWYQACIRVDVYVSTFLYASSAYSVTVTTGIHTTTKRQSFSLKDGNKQHVATYDVVVTKENSGAFNAWCSVSASISGATGGSPSTGYNVSVGQGWWHTVSYDANGGAGAPSSQIKYWGATIALSATKPTRTDYIFTGWLASYDGKTVLQPGNTYTHDQCGGTVKLTAQWLIEHKPPTVTLGQPYRVASEADTEPSPLGEYVRVPVTWSCDQTGYSSAVLSGLAATVTADGSTEVTGIAYSGTDAGETGTRYVIFPLGAGSYAEVKVTVTEAATGDPSLPATEYSTEAAAYVGKARVPLDVAHGGGSVGILTVAGEDDSISLGGLTLTGVNGQPEASHALSALLQLLDGVVAADGTASLRAPTVGLDGGSIQLTSQDGKSVAAPLYRPWTHLYNDSGSFVRWCCRMGIVFVEWVVKFDSTLNEAWSSGTIPAGYRPGMTVYGGGGIWQTNSCGYAYVENNGNTVIWHAGKGWCEGQLCYPVG